MAERFYMNQAGTYVGSFDVDQPELVEVDSPPDNHLAVRVGNAWQEPTPDNRELRRVDYIKELSAEGDFVNSYGDLADAMVKALYGDFTELDILKTKIDTIKARHV